MPLFKSGYNSKKQFYQVKYLWYSVARLCNAFMVSVLFMEFLTLILLPLAKDAPSLILLSSSLSPLAMAVMELLTASSIVMFGLSLSFGYKINLEIS